MNDQTTNASETDLFVDVDNLAEDGNTLITQANAINDNIIAIRKMLGDGWDSWDNLGSLEGGKEWDRRHHIENRAIIRERSAEERRRLPETDEKVSEQ